MQTRKVYCDKCIYYKSESDINACCMCPNNIKPNNVGQFTNQYLSSPKIINEFNNCRWYISKNGDVSHTTFSLTNIPYGPMKYQLTNDGNMYYTLSIQSVFEDEYKWTSNFHDILWDRELYLSIGKNSIFALNGSIKNESDTSVTIDYSLDIKTMGGITLKLTEDKLKIEPNQSYIFNKEKLNNIIFFNDMYLMNNDILNFSFKVSPQYEVNENGSSPEVDKAKWKLTLNELVLSID